MTHIKNKYLISVIHWTNRYFNLKMGLMAGFATGSIVYLINLNYCINQDLTISARCNQAALFSFGKQFIYNLAMAGYNSKICEKLSRAFHSKYLSLTIATLLPSLIGFVMIYAIHRYGGTPHPWGSTYWQFLANLPIFFFTAFVFRNHLEKKYKTINLFMSTRKWKDYD